MRRIANLAAATLLAGGVCLLAFAALIYRAAEEHDPWPS